MNSHNPNTSLETSARSRKPAEEAARAAIGSQMGRTLSDEEWARMRGRLVEFARILRSWIQTRPADEPPVAGMKFQVV